MKYLLLILFLNISQTGNILVTKNLDYAILAGGCFWCVEADFEKLNGVVEAISGYTGGDMNYPTYRNHGRHIEAVKISFDPEVISYSEILNHYWYNIDPTDTDGQFCDRGNSYRAVIFARADQLEEARISKKTISKDKPFKAPISVPVLKSKRFWVAEDYHQDYYKKKPIRYNYYRKGCKRDAILKRLWKKVG